MGHFLLWMGLLFCVFTCSIPMGVYLEQTFPHTPLMWQTYSTIVTLNGIGGILFAVWFAISGANSFFEPDYDQTGTNSESPFNVRVRVVGSAAGYRLINFPGSSIGQTTMADLDARICAKFPQAHSEGRVHHVASLVRVRDQLELVDDGDVAMLSCGDELE